MQARNLRLDYTIGCQKIGTGNGEKHCRPYKQAPATPTLPT